MKINQMKKDEYFEGFYLIKRAEVRKTRAGKDYIAFTFQDDTGEIQATYGMLSLIMSKNLPQVK